MYVTFKKTTTKTITKTLQKCNIHVTIAKYAKIWHEQFCHHLC